MTLIKKFRWFLAPSILQTLISFATLPLATFVLNPQDYGTYALVVATTGLISALACLGSSYLLSQVFANCSLEDIKRFVSQQVLISVFLSCLLSVGLILVWGLYSSNFERLANVPLIGFLLATFSIIPGTIWAIALDILTLDGRAKLFAVIVILQSITSATILLFCLFVLNWGSLSLFVSGAAGAAVLGIGGCFSLNRYYSYPGFTVESLKVFKNAVSITSANIVEVIYQPVERNLLAVNSGLSSLGLYAHAQQYRTMIAAATKALSRSVWPSTLSEAKQAEVEFPITYRYWAFTYFCLTLVGLAFATMGDFFIGLLTHGKFVGAAPYAAVSVAYLLVQNSGKPHTGIIYAQGHVAKYSYISIVSSIAGIAAAFILIPNLGVWGAITAIFIQQIFMRIAIQIYVSKIVNIPFKESSVIAGVFLIGGVTYLIESLRPDLSFRALIFFISAVFIWVTYKVSIMDLFSRSQIK